MIKGQEFQEHRLKTFQKYKHEINMHLSSLCVSLDLSEIEHIYHGESGQPLN
jgi:hypothetical protein